MNGYFEFKATFWTDGAEHIEKGVTYADTFSHAVEYIESYYGEDLCELSITMLEPYDVYILDGLTKLESTFFNREER